MAQGKVEICGVNTSKLPLLKNAEKEELFSRIPKKLRFGPLITNIFILTPMPFSICDIYVCKCHSNIF